uniref:Uncharacterized protein n=1 Tax=Clytia hemisphaerica TaxID=252671 RepID=A0A7M5UZP9_9CNID
MAICADRKKTISFFFSEVEIIYRPSMSDNTSCNTVITCSNSECEMTTNNAMSFASNERTNERTNERQVDKNFQVKPEKTLQCSAFPWFLFASGESSKKFRFYNIVNQFSANIK